jgi:hypothetical protein
VRGQSTRCGPSFSLDGKPNLRAEGEGAREFHDLLIKVTNFEPISDYRLGPDGRPRLASQTADSKGSMFGFVGGETNGVAYAYR